MKSLFITLLFIIVSGCASGDAVRTIEVATIAAGAKDKIVSSIAAVQADKSVYSDQDYLDLQSNLSGLKSMYDAAIQLGESQSRNRALTQLAGQLPSARTYAKRIYDILKSNLNNNSPESRQVIDDVLFDLERLENNYELTLAQGNRQQIRDTAITYLRLLAPLILKAATRL